MLKEDLVQVLEDLLSKEKGVKDWYSPKEVAERVKRDPETVRNWCRFEQIEATKRGRSWKIPHAELERLKNSNCELKTGNLDKMPLSIRVRVDKTLRDKAKLAICPG